MYTNSTMTYEEAINATITKEEARREIELHGLSFDDFVEDAGDGEALTYPGQKVLEWLGY